MLLEISSILYSLAVVEVVMAAIMLGGLLAGAQVPGLKEIAGANTVGGIAALLLGLGATFREPRLVFVGTVSFVVTVLLAAQAMRRLQDERPRARLEIAMLLFAVVADYYFAVVTHRISGVFVANSTVYVIICGVAAWDLLTERRPRLRSGCRILGVLFAAFAIFQAFRLLLRPLLDSSIGSLAHLVLLDDVQALVAIAVAIGWSVGFLWASYSSAAFRLRAANEELSRFSGAVAHDLKAPLNAVIGFLEAVQHTPAGRDPARRASFIASAHEAATRMNAFVHDLLEHARSAQTDPRIEVVDATLCLQLAQNQLRPQIEAAAARITVGSLPLVAANGMQLTRVFQNLLDNALKYRSSDRLLEIDVSASQRNGMVHFVVRDNGSGVPGIDQARIFESFERSTPPTPADGHGVGLAECRRILMAYGGSIAVEPGRGGGATFAFSLPAAAV